MRGYRLPLAVGWRVLLAAATTHLQARCLPLQRFSSIAFLFRNMLSHSQTLPKGGPPTLVFGA